MKMYHFTLKLKQSTFENWISTQSMSYFNELVFSQLLKLSKGKGHRTWTNPSRANYYNSPGK